MAVPLREEILPTPHPLSAAITPHPDGAILAVVVTPRVGKTALDRVDAQALRVRIAAPPVDGAANTALLRFLAEAAGLPRARVRLLASQTGRRKRLLFEGLSPGELTARLLPLLPYSGLRRG